MYDWEFAWDRGWEGITRLPNAKFQYFSLLNFQFLKPLPVPQFSVLNPQIFVSY